MYVITPPTLQAQQLLKVKISNAFTACVHSKEERNKGSFEKEIQIAIKTIICDWVFLKERFSITDITQGNGVKSSTIPSISL